MIGSQFDSEALSVLASSHVVLVSPENKNIDAEILVNSIRSIEPRKIVISGFDKSTNKTTRALMELLKLLGVKKILNQKVKHLFL